MTSHNWQTVLALALVLNGLLIASYRIFRMKKGGPKADAIGGAVLGGMLCLLALLVWLDIGWARWPAGAYAALFAFIVMPIWTLAVLIPLPPRAPDWIFTTIYWGTLVVIGIAALLS